MSDNAAANLDNTANNVTEDDNVALNATADIPNADINALFDLAIGTNIATDTELWSTGLAFDMENPSVNALSNAEFHTGNRWNILKSNDHVENDSEAYLSVKRRVEKEIIDWQKNPIPYLAMSLKNDNLFQWSTSIMGPPGTVYEGGKFKIDIFIPKDYPFRPPKCRARTKIYHCNISSNGDICLDILRDNWSPALTISKLLLSISALLTDPNPNDPICESAAVNYKNNRKKHDRIAREWTKRYAQDD